jgi:hypothetical protein
MAEKSGMGKKEDSEMTVSPDFRKLFVDGFGIGSDGDNIRVMILSQIPKGGKTSLKSIMSAEIELIISKTISKDFKEAIESVLEEKKSTKSSNKERDL